MNLRKSIACVMISTFVFSSLIPTYGIAAQNQSTTKNEPKVLTWKNDLPPDFKNGFKEPTELAKKWSERNMKKIDGIRPNKVGLERIKKASPNANLNDIVPVEFGDELKTSSESTGGTNGQYASVADNSLTGTPATASATLNSNASLILPMTSSYYPSSVDNSQLDCFPPIRNQEGLGACAAFSTTYYQLTHMAGLVYNWNTKNDLDNTNKMSPKWTYNFTNRGINEGTSIDDVFYLLTENGCATWSEFPYNGDATNPLNYTQWSTDKNVWENAFKYRIKDCGKVTINNVLSNTDQNLVRVKELLINGYILTFGNSNFDFNYGTVMNDPYTTADDAFVGQQEVICMKNGKIAHAMTMVGYNDDIWIDMNGNRAVDQGEKGAFKIANSWGANYHNNGFFWLSYDSVNDTSSVPGFIVPPEGRIHSMRNFEVNWMNLDTKSRPTVLAEITINSDNRCNLLMNFGLGETNQNSPTIDFSPYITNIYNGMAPQSISFDGTNNIVDGVFVFDVTKLSEYSHNASDRRWFANITDIGLSNYPSIIKSVNLVDAVNKNIVSYNNSSLPVSVTGNTVTVYTNSSFNNLLGRPWTLMTTIPKTRRQAAITSANNKIYMMGGYGETGIMNDVTVFNPSGNTWATETPMKTYRSSMGITSLNGKIYTIGGTTQSGTISNIVEVYDTNSKTWASVANLKESLASVSAVACNGKIYAFGGLGSVTSRNIEVYDPATNTWTIKASLPEALQSFSTVELNGNIYIMGGYTVDSSTGTVYSDSTYRYDPVSNSLTKLASRNYKGALQNACALFGKIYLFPTSIETKDTYHIEVYDPQSDSWSLGNEPIVPLNDYYVTALNNNAYLFGGTRADGYLYAEIKAVQRYSPNVTLVDNDFLNYYGNTIPGQQKWSNIGVERLNGYTQNDYKLRFDDKDVLTLELNTTGYKDLILEYSSSGFLSASGTFNVDVNPFPSDPTKWTNIATYTTIQNEWIKKYHNLSTDLENKQRIAIKFRFDKNTMAGVVAVLQYIRVYGRNNGGLAPVSSTQKTQFVNERFSTGTASSKWALNGCNALTGSIEMDNSDTATCTFSTKGYKNVTIQYNVNYYYNTLTPSSNRLNVLANSTPADPTKFALIDSIPYADFFGNTRKTDLGGAFDNMDNVQVKFALNQTTATDTGNIYNFIVTGDPIKTNVLSDLGVYDMTFNYDCTSNDYGWFLQSGLSTGSYLFGDRQILATSIPSALLGAEWISPAYNSRLFSGSTLATFKTNAYANVFIAYDDKITQKPSWFSGWSDTGMDIKCDDGGTITYSVFKKTFAAGSTINLGQNNTDPNAAWQYNQYIVLAKPVIISDLSVKDAANAVDWSLQSNPSTGNNLYGDRTLTITTLPSILNGAEWIRVANDSKTYTASPLATFKVNSTSDIFIAYDDRITTKPSWFTGWSDTGTDIKDSQNPSISYSVFKKTFIGGSTVTLGQNGHTSYCQYSVFAKPVTIMSNLTVNDAANEMDWSIRTNPSTGNLLFGDRTLTITTLPSSLTGAEWIRPANDSKTYTGTPLATFKVNVNTDIYIAYDDRVTTKPSWFTGWTDTGTDVKDSQATPGTYSVFKKTFTAGSTVTLGPSNASSFCQYVIFAKPQGL